MKEIIETAPSVEEAIESACTKLGVSRDLVEFEILELPSKKILGLFGNHDAKVRVYYEESPEVRAKSYLRDIFDNMGLPNADIIVSREDNQINIFIEGEGLGIIIGKRGNTLDALQYLTGLVANKSSEPYCRISLDTGNFREKREKSLQGLARKTAIQVSKTGKSVTFEAMNPYERRIIHSTVWNMKGATSWSIGEEPNRKVVIGPTAKSKPSKYNNRVEKQEAKGEGKKEEHIDLYNNTLLYGRIDK